MDGIRDHFVCGICKAGFRSTSFLQYLEHMIRHFSVGRSNNCIICHKAFARTPSLKDHLLHFHAIPLKISPDCRPDAENADKMLPPGSARCNSFHKKEQYDDKGFCFNLSGQNQSQHTSSSCIGDIRSNVQDQSKIKTFDVIENSDIAIDVLTIKDVEQDNITKSVELLPEQYSHFNNNCDEDSILALGIPPPKDINPNIFLLDPPATEMNFDAPPAQSLSSAKYKCSEADVAENFLSYKNDPKSRIISFDKSKIKSNELYGSASKMDIDQCPSSNGNHFSLKSGKIQVFDSMRIDNGFSGNMNEQQQNEQNTMSCQHEVNSHHNQKSDLDLKGIKKLVDPSKKPDGLDPKQRPTFQSMVGEKGINSFEGSLLSGSLEDHIDFHFFLGTTVINGSSMTYNRTEFRCFHCPFVSAWRPSLVKHMKNIHKEALDFHKILDVKNVHSRSLNDEKLKKYKVIKLSEHILANRKVRKRKKMSKITDRQDIAGKYSCPVCNKVFRRLRYMRRHQLTHRTERNLLCDTCGKSFKTKATFVAHHRSHKSRYYHCPQCDFKSNLSSAIHRHRQIHPNGSVVCDICGIAYIDKSTLKKHRRVHDMSRPFPCTFPGCTWRFKTESLKKAHLQAHTTEGKFRCLQCGYHFRHKHHLQRHLSRVHTQVSLSSKLQSDAILPDSLDLESGTTESSVFFTPADHPGNSANLPLCSTKPLPNTQEMLLSSISESLQPAANISGHCSREIKMPETSVDIYVRNKQSPETSVNNKTMDTSVNIGIENASIYDNLPANTLNNLEFVTENGEIIQFVKPNQVYMRQDSYGNLVEYRITNIHPEEDINQSRQVYFIGADGTVLGTVNQEQAILLP